MSLKTLYRFFLLTIVAAWFSFMCLKHYLEKVLDLNADNNSILSLYESYEMLMDFIPIFVVLMGIIPQLKPVKKWLGQFSLWKDWNPEIAEESAILDAKRNLIHVLKGIYAGYLDEYAKSCKGLSGLDLVTLKFLHHPDVSSIQINSQIATEEKTNGQNYINGKTGNSVDQIILNDPTIDVFFAVILGDAGCGKSYSFVKRLHESLLKIPASPSAEFIKGVKIPILFDAGDYRIQANVESNALEIWLSDSLKKHYKIASKQVRNWLIEGGHLAICLDGLDEIPQLDRIEFMKAIKAYSEKNKTVIISSRKEEFVRLQSDLPVSPQIYEVESLDRHDIDNIIGKIYIDNPEHQTAIRSVLDSKSELYNYLKVPLILNLFVKTFATLNENDISRIKQLPVEGCLLLLWEKYDPLIFAERLTEKQQIPGTVVKEKSLHISSDQQKLARTYAAWLSRQIDNKTFYIEDIQPRWLLPHDPQTAKSNSQVWAYYYTSRVLSAVLLAIAVGFLIASPLDFLGNGVLAGVLVSFLTLKTLQIKISPWVTIVLFVSCAALLCGLYQGLTVPRQHADMYGLFSVTESFSGIVFGLIAGLTFGFRKIKQTAELDIQPVEQRKFSWGQAVRHGLAGGAAVGFLIGTIGVIIQLQHDNRNTFTLWLRPFLQKMSQMFTQHVMPFKYSETLMVFILGYGVAFIVAFMIIGVIRGRQDVTTIEKDSRTGLNSGMLKSLENALIYGVLTFATIGILYSLCLYTVSGLAESVTRALRFSLGLAIIASLWFGGFELIHHWTLRFYLYLSGRVPLRYASWVQTMHKIDFVRQTGARIKIHHLSLKEYLLTLPLAPTPNANNEAMIHSFRPHYRRNVLYSRWLGLSMLFIMPFIDRFGCNKFWNQENEIVYRHNDEHIQKIAANVFKAKKDCSVSFIVDGSVKLGTFVGSIAPSGTSAGFLGFPMDTVYNLFGNFRHGALLLKRSVNPNKWEYLIAPKFEILGMGPSKAMLQLKKGESFEFCINDNEWQNNSGHFLIQMESKLKELK